MSRKSDVRWDDLTAQDLADRWSREVRLEDETGSTNDVGKQWAESGAPEGALVLARRQKRGRGRVGRTWYSPKDAGVYVSAIFHPRDLSHPAPLAILAGLGIAEALNRSFPTLEARIKWPNDLMAGSGKLGGILAEASWMESHPRFLVVGVGVNVRPLRKRAPEDVRTGGTSVDGQIGEKTPLLAVADAIVTGLDAHVRNPVSLLTEGLLARIDRLDWLRERRVVLRSFAEGDEGVSGTCVGIAPDGALLFRPDRGALRRVQSGTVDWR